MQRYKLRELERENIQADKDFKEFFGISREEYFSQYKDIWEKFFLNGQFEEIQWHNYSFKKYIPHLVPNNEEELLEAYGSKEMTMPLCIEWDNDMFAKLTSHFNSRMDLKTGDTIWRTLNYWNNIKGLKVMDFGCGNGKTGLSMWTHGVDLSLVDVAGLYGEYIKWLIKKYKLVEIEWFDSSIDIDFDIEKFDYIIASECLEHIFEPIIYVEKLYKALKFGGIIYLSPNFGADFGDHKGYLGDYLHLKRNYERYDNKPWFDIVRNIGFRPAEDLAKKLSYDSEIFRQIYEHKKIYTK